MASGRLQNVVEVEDDDSEPPMLEDEEDSEDEDSTSIPPLASDGDDGDDESEEDMVPHAYRHINAGRNGMPADAAAAADGVDADGPPELVS